MRTAVELEVAHIEKRQFGRRSRRLFAEIVTPSRPPLPCIIRNISDSGALLEIDLNFFLPTYFVLRVSADGFEADCEMRHQTESGVGVFFSEVRIARRGRDTRTAHDLPVRTVKRSA